MHEDNHRYPRLLAGSGETGFTEAEDDFPIDPDFRTREGGKALEEDPTPFALRDAPVGRDRVASAKTLSAKQINRHIDALRESASRGWIDDSLTG